MSFSHVATKLHIPATRPALLNRPRLMAQLNRCTEYKLLLVCAPAGYGKTSLLSQWSQKSVYPVAWVSLDETDNDPIHFWSYVATALGKIEPRVGLHTLPVVHAQRPFSIEYMIPTLINAVTLISGHVALVLDDYHCIESQDIHAAVAYLLDYLPPNMHVILAGRNVPPLPLARWRARGQLAELGTAELSLTRKETTHLLNEVLALHVPAETADTLYARTEGWIAGLQLAALAMQEQPGRFATIHAADPALQGSGPYIVDYLAAEVLEQQPEEIQSFLLQTSILDTLGGPLCDAVTGRTDSAQILYRLHQRSLFIAALDGKAQYRYHPLFAESLQQALVRGRISVPPLTALHERAAAWYHQQGETDQTIRHYLAAGQVQKAVDLIAATARSRLALGELQTLRDCLEALPAEAILDRPLLCLVYAWVLTHAGQVDKAAPYLDHLEAHLPEGQEAALLLGESAAVRARMAVVRGDQAGMIRFSRQSLALLPAEATALRCDALLDLAFAYGAMGDPSAAQDALAQVLELGRASGQLRTAMLALYYLGDLYVGQGQLHGAARLYQQGREWCRESDPPSNQACWAHAGLGALLYEWDDLDGALDHLPRAVQLARQAGEVKVLIYPRIHLARAQQTLGHAPEALSTLDAAAGIAQQIRVVDIQNQINVARMEVWLRAGEVNTAGSWLQQHGIGLSSETLSQPQATMLAWFYLAAPPDRRALTQVAEWIETHNDARYPLALVRNLILLALVHQALGRQEQAVAEAGRALSLAEPMGLVRTFVDHGAPMAELLDAIHVQIAASGRRPAIPRQTATVGAAYLDTLIAACRSASPAVPVTSTTSEAPPAAADEPLRAREIEVLQHLAQGYSNSEIADEMVMAVSTVKWYLRNIYDKLDVRRRTQALARARELGLV